MKRVYKVLILIAFFVGFYFLKGNCIKAAYKETCNGEQIQAKNGTYTKCDNNIIYLLKADKSKSSYIVANRDIEIKNQILYAGKIDGLETFYSLNFNYYSVTYDNRSLFNSKENVYSDISVNGVVLYSGKIKDNALVDQSSSFFVRDFYNEQGTYLIRQFIGNKIVSAIRVIVVDKDDLNMSISNARYGDEKLGDSNLIYSSNKDLYFNVSEGDYGFGNNIDVKVNECSFSVSFSKNLVIDSNDIRNCLKQNDQNVVSLTIYNGFGNSKKFNYKFYLQGKYVSVKLEDNVSDLVATSRRVVIKASPGFGNNLDEEHCLYYWSKNPDDKLTYADFMSNYELSEYKGEYTSNKGVIIRDNYGSYYLYALAKDDISSIVVRSDEYVFTKNTRLNKVERSDVIFVVSLCVCAIIPVIIYLFVRGKDTY